MKCKYCQAELEDGAAICPVCGKEQDAAEEESVRAEQAPAPAQTPDNAETPASEAAAAEVQSPAAPEIKSGIKATPGKIALAVTAGIVVLAVLVALVISGISGGFASLKHTGADAQATTATVETGTASTDAAEATEGTIPADGNPDDVTCKGTYTATDDEVIAAADTVVATMGGKELTVGQLQIYYWTEVYDFLNQYASYASYFGLDYTQPLDKQSCDLGETPMTWQQYFLQCAIDAWRSYQGLALEGEEAGLTMDAEFQGYLDSLPGDLEAMAADYGITLNMESLNRFEGYMINEASECIDYVKAVDRPNVKAMLDTFHMNIEEDSITEAIRKSGALLGHFHVGEANRRCPGPGGRFDWAEIGKVLKEINYGGYVVMEPFVTMGGQVGKDISIWRDLSHGATEEQLDADAAASVAYLRRVMG